MKLGTQVGLGLGHTVLDRNPAPPLQKRSRAPAQFSAHVYCGQTAGWIKMPLSMAVELGPGHIELDGDKAPLPKRGTAAEVSAHICCGQMAGWIKMPLGRKVSLSPSDIVLDGDPASLSQKGAEPSIFGPSPSWLNGWMDQDGTWYGGRPRPSDVVLDEPPVFGPCIL